MQQFMGVQCQPIAGHSLGWVFPMKETRFGGRESADLGLALKWIRSAGNSFSWPHGLPFLFLYMINDKWDIWFFNLKKS